jgi:NADH:ubiquinone oxidoreductase subunit 3 (subunit A)
MLVNLSIKLCTSFIGATDAQKNQKSARFECGEKATVEGVGDAF